jgi:hypothetical protein
MLKTLPNSIGNKKKVGLFVNHVKMKRVFILFTFASCVVFSAAANNNKPSINGEGGIEKAPETVTKVKMSGRVIKESTVSLGDANFADAVAATDADSGKGKKTNKKTCKNGAGSCKPNVDSEDEADL